MSLPKWKFEYMPHLAVEPQRVPYMLLHWHSANRLHLPLAWLEVDGKRLNDQELYRLNLWIQGLGAWRVSAMPWPEASKVLEQLLAGRLGKIPVGHNGAGRWATGTELEVFFRDRCKGG